MTFYSHTSSFSRYVFLGMITVLLGVLAFPALSHAALYAYVNQAGEVRTVVANTPSEAIATAPSIHVRSGVLLIDSTSDSSIVGDDVPGT